VDHPQLTDQLLAELHTLQSAKQEPTEDLTTEELIIMQRDTTEDLTTLRDITEDLTTEEDLTLHAKLEQSEDADHLQLTDQPLAELHSLHLAKPEDNLLEEDTEEELTTEDQLHNLNQSSFNLLQSSFNNNQHQFNLSMLHNQLQSLLTNLNQLQFNLSMLHNQLQS